MKFILISTTITLLSVSVLCAASTTDLEAPNDSNNAENGSEIGSNTLVDRLSSVSLASVHDSGLRRPLIQSMRIRGIPGFRSSRSECITWTAPTAFFFTLLALVAWMLVELL